MQSDAEVVMGLAHVTPELIPRLRQQLLHSACWPFPCLSTQAPASQLGGSVLPVEEGVLPKMGLAQLLVQLGLQQKMVLLPVDHLAQLLVLSVH